jgi:hypothetical protein
MPCSAGADIGLKAPAGGRVSVTLILEAAATEHLARTVGGEIVLSDIDAAALPPREIEHEVVGFKGPVGGRILHHLGEPDSAAEQVLASWTKTRCSCCSAAPIC